jgi:hypothetical protein
MSAALRVAQHRNTVSGAPRFERRMGQLARHEGFEPAAAAFRAKGP